MKDRSADFRFFNFSIFRFSIFAALLSQLFDIGTGFADSRRAVRDAFGIAASLSLLFDIGTGFADSRWAVRDAFGIAASLSPSLSAHRA